MLIGNFDGAMRQLLLNVERTGIPFESTGHPASDYPYQDDVRRALENRWIRPDEKGRYELTPEGTTALGGMR